MTKEIININSASDLASFANTLKEFIVKQKLFSNIQGRNYVNVEGWEFAGVATGMTPILKKVKCLSTENEIKYRAEVELINIQTQQPIGYGVAICSSKERGKNGPKWSDEYAVCSMAQTRAIGKAYRNKLAFLMKMAGYEPTPAEEIVEEKKEETQEDMSVAATDNQKETIRQLGGKYPSDLNKAEAAKMIKGLSEVQDGKK